MNHHRDVHGSHNVTLTMHAHAPTVLVAPMGTRHRIDAPAAPDEVVPGAWETDGGHIYAGAA
jgi:hypothetical protein